VRRGSARIADIARERAVSPASSLEVLEKIAAGGKLNVVLGDFGMA
jgi:hypothetical protein